MGKKVHIPLTQLMICLNFALMPHLSEERIQSGTCSPERPRWQYPDLPWRKSKGTSRSATRTVKEIALWSNSKFQFLQHNKVMSTFRHVFWTQDTCWTLLESYLYVFEYIQHALMQLQLKNKLGPSSCPLRLQHSPFQPESWLWSVDLNSRAAIFYR